MSGGGVNWCDFISALSKLAQAESAYFNLSYMEKSWSDSWRRKREVYVCGIYSESGHFILVSCLSIHVS